MALAVGGATLGAAALAQTAPVDLPEITVTAPSPIQRGASSAASSADPLRLTLRVADQSFSPVTFLTAGEILRSGDKTLGDQLFTLPGITNSGFAPGATDRPVIRGLDNFRVRIQENGVGSQDVSDIGEDHGVPIDPLAAQRIEVIRGPATLRYGSQAIGGVVSVDNNRIPTLQTPPGFSGEIRTGLSSVDRGLETSALTDARAGRFAVHGDVYRRRSDDYSIPGPDKRQFNSFAQSDGQAIGGSYFLPDNGGYLGLSLSRFTSLYGIPGADAQETRTRIDLEQTKLLSKGEVRVDSAYLDAIRYWIGGSYYKHKEEGLEGGSGAFETGAIFKNREIEARIEAQLKPVSTGLGALTTAIGAQAGRQAIGTSGEAGGLLAPATNQSIAAYIFNELQVRPGTRLQAAGRIEHARVSGTGAVFPADLLGGSGEPVDDPRTRRFLPVSLSLGLLQDLPFGFVGSLTGQYVERAPKPSELYSRGAHDAPATFEIGDPSLKKEVAKTVELGLRRAVGPWRLDASFYATRYDGFIYRRATGIRCDDDFESCGAGDELTQVVYTQRNATFVGGELRTQYDFAMFGPHVFGAEAQYDIVRATFAGGENVPRMPPQRVGGGLYYRGFDHWFARVNLLHAFAQRDVAPEETPTSGYNLLTAELSYRTRLSNGPFGPVELMAGVVGTNLLNQTVRNSVSFRKDEVVAPGRGVRGFLRLRF